MINSSYNIVVERLKTFAEGHKYIKSFKHDLLDGVDIMKGVEYPIMQVIPGSITPVIQQLSYTFDIVFADLPRRKTNVDWNTKEVISDMSRIALDLVFEITNGLTLFGREVVIDGTPQITSFIENYENTLAGVTLSITIQVPDNWNACIIPADWATGGTGYPSEGLRPISIPVLDENNFVVDAYELDFRGSGVTVTRTGNTAIITITGGGGGGGLTCEDLPTCEVIVDIQDAIDTLQTSLTALTSTVSTLSATVGGIQNDITEIEGDITTLTSGLNAANVAIETIETEQVTQNNAITAIQNEIDNLAFVESIVAGDDINVDATDPANPIVGVTPNTFVRLSGTESGFPVTGNIEIESGFSIFNRTINYDGSILFDNGELNIYAVDLVNNLQKKYSFSPSLEQTYNVSRIQDIKSRLWNKAGAPTTTDDADAGYVANQSLILDTTSGIIYKCTDATAGAAVWVVFYDPSKNKSYEFFSVGTGIGINFPAGSTRFYQVTGVQATNAVTNSAFVATKIGRACTLEGLEIVTTTTQPASGTQVWEVFQGINPASMSGTGIQVTIPAGGVANTYTSSGTFNLPAGNYISFRQVNNASANSATFAVGSTMAIFNNI